MPRQCLFCPNSADSAEHIWSDWILQDLKPVKPIRIKIGKTFTKWVDNRELRIKCVCQKCNSGWMSEIESENKPHMHAMMNGKSTVLQPAQQKLLTRWATLKSMVLDGSSKRRIPCFSESDRLAMKPPLRALPVDTFTWIGCLSTKQFHAGLTDTYGAINEVPNAYRACITTIIVGHFVIQVMTMNVRPCFATIRAHPKGKTGAWDLNLLDIWPVFGEKSWPPPFSFDLGGTTHHIGTLINRWKIGEDITK